MIKRDEKLEKQLAEQLTEQVDVSDAEVSGAVLTALADVYKAVGSEMFGDAVKDVADRVLADESAASDCENLQNYELGKGMYAAYDVTKDDRYREFAVKTAKNLKTQPRYEEGFFKGSHDGGEKKLCRAYMYIPFYMDYETRDGGKEQYNDIIAQIRSFKNTLFDGCAAKCADDDAAYNIMAHFAAALIDTMEVMDQMLYEIYHEMTDYYREAVKVLCAARAGRIGRTKADYMFGYALFKGCRMKALLTEKYDDVASGLMDDMDKPADNTYMLAVKTMYYSEAVRNREYQDYGRGKGGVLWS